MASAFLLLKAGPCAQTAPVGITLRQFQEMSDRLSGRKARAPEPVFEATRLANAGPRVILGIDPSLRGTGYGVIRLGRPHPRALAFGTIACPASWSRSRCLVRIAEALRAVVREHAPGVCVVEALFYAQNLQTAMILGEARGAALTVAAEAGLDIYEIAPRKVKQAIVGYGAAQKLAVAKMVQRLLNLPSMPEPDAADALALALAHAQEQTRHRLTPAKRI